MRTEGHVTVDWSNGMPRVAGSPQTPGRGLNFLSASRGNQSCQHLDFRLLACRVMRMNSCCVKPPGWCVVTVALGNEHPACHSGVFSARLLIQAAHSCWCWVSSCPAWFERCRWPTRTALPVRGPAGGWRPQTQSLEESETLPGCEAPSSLQWVGVDLARLDWKLSSAWPGACLRFCA